MNTVMKDLSPFPNDTGIEPNYRHAPKRVAPGQALEIQGATFKWYAVEAPDLPVPETVAELARAFLPNKELEAKGLGFVILHLCGREFYFLLVSTCRGNNEVWETVFYEEGDGMTDFALFPREKAHKPTFCVWEVAAGWHEKQAWERFLGSARNSAAVEVWLRDLYTGET